MNLPFTEEEQKAKESALQACLTAEAPREVVPIPRDFHAALTFEGIRVPGGTVRELSLVSEKACFPKRIYVPSEVAQGMSVQNIIVKNQGFDVPFFDDRDRTAELFDGCMVDGEVRETPYGFLPRVKADAGERIVLRVHNLTAEDRPFTAVLAVEYAP